MAALCVFVIVALSLSRVNCQLCSDLDVGACKRLIDAKADFCLTSPLATSACQRTCGHCPLTCYHCPATPVRNPTLCKNTMVCPGNETCIIKTLHAHDGHMEHLMSCGSTQLCNGFGFGFHAAVGKRRVQSRDISLHCCHEDLCNTPLYTTTTLAPTKFPVTAPPTFSCHNDVVFVVDESGSVGAAGFNKIIAFITSLVQRLDIGIHETQVGLLVYDNLPHVEWQLGDYTTKAGVLGALTYVPYHDGISRTDLALKYVDSSMLQYAHGDRLSAHNVVVVITDGRSTTHPATVAAANKLKADGATVVAIGVGATVDQELVDIATDSNHALKVTGLDHFPNAIPLVLPLICA